MTGALWVLLVIAYLVGGAFLAHWMGRRLSARAIPPSLYPPPNIPAPQPPAGVLEILWWNGCTSEVTKASGLHGANAIAYICSEQPRARA